MSDEILIKPNKDGVWDKYEPYAIIHVETEEDFNHMNELMRVGEKMQWIPCSEKLPEIREGLYSSNCVLTTMVSADGSSFVCVGFYHKGIGWINGINDEKVIAWMPLPEPYKGE